MSIVSRSANPAASVLSTVRVSVPLNWLAPRYASVVSARFSWEALPVSVTLAVPFAPVLTTAPLSAPMVTAPLTTLSCTVSVLSSTSATLMPASAALTSSATVGAVGMVLIGASLAPSMVMTMAASLVAPAVSRIR